MSDVRHAVRVLTTGGTIDKVYFDARSEFEVGEPIVDTILTEALVAVPWTVDVLMRRDSLELTRADREQIRDAAAAAPEDHIMITHGTDTMSETAEFLREIAREKTIVLTGSLSPARFRNSDAVFNIGAAFSACQVLEPGVYIAINGRIFSAGQVRKNTETNRFEAT